MKPNFKVGFGFYGCVLLGFLIYFDLKSALSSEFENGLNRLKQQQKTLSDKLKKFGIEPGQKKSRDQSDDSDLKDKPQLFKVHSDFKTQTIFPGKLLFGKTYTRLIVGSEGSPLLIILDEDQGAFSGLKILGSGRASATQGRLILEFNRLILNTGKTIPVSATALDASGGYGLSAQVFSGKALALAGSMASGFISGMALGSQTQNANAFGFNQVEHNSRNAILQGLASSASDQSKRLIEEATQEKPILVVEEGTELGVLFQEELRL